MKNIIQESFATGKIFAGGSAGAAIAGPTLEPLQTIDDPKEAPELEDYTAFGFIDFIVLPHFDHSSYKQKYEAIIQQYSQFTFQPLNNDQAIFVEGKEYQIL